MIRRGEHLREGAPEDDIEVGVTYFGGRYYAANLGRWMSADPVAVHQQKGNLNVYQYARGNVFRVTDPTGLEDEGGPVGAASDAWDGMMSAVSDGWSGMTDGIGDAASGFMDSMSAAADQFGQTNMSMFNATNAANDEAGQQFMAGALQAGAYAMTGPTNIANSTESANAPAYNSIGLGQAAAMMGGTAIAGVLLGKTGGAIMDALGVTGAAAADGAGAAALSTTEAPATFIGQQSGPSIVVPTGASGPIPTQSPGFQYNGGAGGNGLAGNVTDVRIMDSNGGYVNYGSRQANGGWQSVNPYTGRAVPPSDPWWHIPLQ